MATKPDARLVRRIMQDQINRHFSLAGKRIERQSVTILPIPDSQEGRFAGSTLTVRGQTNFTDAAWAIYRGQFGHWQALISSALRVGPPHPIEGHE